MSIADLLWCGVLSVVSIVCFVLAGEAFMPSGRKFTVSAYAALGLLFASGAIIAVVSPG